MTTRFLAILYTLVSKMVFPGFPPFPPQHFVYLYALSPRPFISVFIEDPSLTSFSLNIFLEDSSMFTASNTFSLATPKPLI